MLAGFGSTGGRLAQLGVFYRRVRRAGFPCGYNNSTYLGGDPCGIRAGGFKSERPSILRIPQTILGEGVGKISNLPLGPLTLPSRIESGVDNLAVNLLFRYPIWATTDLPHGRWFPYAGIGGGFQRARLSTQGYEETSYSLLFQGLVGAKFFLIKHVAIFGEAQYTQGWHPFNYAELGVPSDSKERYTIVTGIVMGGVAMHFKSSEPNQHSQPRACSSCSCKVLHSMQSVVTGRALSRL